MNARGLSRHTISILLISCTAFALLLSACQTADPTTIPQPTQPPAQPTHPPSQPTATETAIALPPQSHSEPTQPPAQPTQAPTTSSEGITLALSGVAEGMRVEIIPAVDESAGGPWYEIGPAYRLLSLQGYPVTNSLFKPQIYVYSLEELSAANENIGTLISELQTLLENHEFGDQIPYLPKANIIGAQEMIKTQVRFFDFQSGRGIRFLTHFGNGMAPINNQGLQYTFQGITSDGKYYLAVVMPVTNPELPADATVDPSQQGRIPNDFMGYLSRTTDMLNQQPDNTYTPDLSALDAMVKSIEVQ